MKIVALFFLALWVVEGQQIAPSAQKQIAALLAEKTSRTFAQQKISSHLVHAAKALQGQPIHPDFPTPRDIFSSVRLDSRNRVEIDINADVTPGLLDYIRSLNGTILTSYPNYGAVRATLPLLAVERLAGRPDVHRVRSSDRGYTSQATVRTQSPRLRVSRAPKVASRLGNFLRNWKHERSGLGGLSRALGSAFFIGLDASGDIAHQANVARATYGVDGTGVTIGVLSSGVDSLILEQSTGRLPNVNVLPGQNGNGDEGTAILEVLYTLAPGAKLYFGTANGGEAAMAGNIQALAAAGCNIIIDDEVYTEEPVFQDGIIAQAVNGVEANGVFYFSSTGNEGSIERQGVTSVWEGDFASSSGVPGLPPGTDVNGFGPFASPWTTILGLSRAATYTLNWSDPLGASGNDYDLFILDQARANVIEYSTDVQNGTQDPQETIEDAQSLVTTGDVIVVVRNTGATVRALHVDSWDGALEPSTDGAPFGHHAAAAGFAVAAVDAHSAGGGPFTGLYPSNLVESFSSAGPRRMFYKPDGTQITPGNILFGTLGGTVLNKPDFAAADGVTTGLASFNPFYGTSAAAPHAAAIAALVLESNPSITVTQMRNVFWATAIDIETAGFDPLSGAGIVMAPPAMAQPIVQCEYALSAGGIAFQDLSAGTATIQIYAPPGCPWVVNNLPPWVRLAGPSSGIGNGSLTFIVSDNDTTQPLSASITIAGTTFSLAQQAFIFTPQIGWMPHLAAGGGWTTTFTYLNKGPSMSIARTTFAGSSPVWLPLEFPQQQTNSGPVLASTIDQSIAPNASLLMQAVEPANSPLLEGAAVLASAGAVDGFAIFHYGPTSQEASVPLQVPGATSYVLPFDNTGPLSTGVAIATELSCCSQLTQNIAVVVRDDTGTQIETATVEVNIHTSFMLNQLYPITAGRRGTVQFSANPGGGSIGVLGIRANGSALTTVPAIASSSAVGGSIAHVTYNGGFTSALQLVNTGTSAASFTLNFFDENGGPLPVPLSLPQSGATITTSALRQTLAAGAMLLIESQANAALPSISGSAQLTTTGSISGFEIFDWTTFGQEASVPIETRTPNSFLLIYDDTGGLTTGVALSNVAATAANIAVNIYDDAGTLLQTAAVDLPGNGHTAFMLPGQYSQTANKRGMVEFVVPQGGKISAIGLRATPAGTLTTIPMLAR